MQMQRRIQMIAAGLRFPPTAATAAWISASTTATSSQDPFGHEGQSKIYKKYRPNYVEDQWRDIEQVLASRKGTRDLAIDLCCGTGQVTEPLLSRFKFRRVIGVDRSLAQLNQAKESSTASGIQYVEADVLGYMDTVPENSVDLVTIAQALHWIPIEEFIGRAFRMLKPKTGVLVIMGYGCPMIQGSDDARKAFERYYFDILGSHLDRKDPRNMWDCDRVLLDSAHESQVFDPPFTNVKRMWYPSESALLSEVVDSFIAYLSSWSAYNQLKAKTRPPLAVDPLQVLEKELKRSVGASGAAFKVIVPYWSVLCCRP